MTSLTEPIEYADFSFSPEISVADKEKPKLGQPKILVQNISRLEQTVFLGRAIQLRQRIALLFSQKSLWTFAGLSFSVKQTTIATLVFLILSSTGISGILVQARFGAAEITPRAFAFGPVTPPEFPEQVARPLGNALFNEFSEILAAYHPDIENSTSIEVRKHLLYRYLSEWNSPLVENIDTIAVQPYWQLILAISFAESSLGKKCADNNCSGIGVAPGHPKWQKYESRDDWVMALNRLLNKRYKNQTLDQMCGVYVQPCTDNWLRATGQILKELKERGIN